LNIDVKDGKIIISKEQQIEDIFQKMSEKHGQTLTTKQIKNELKQRYQEA
jgi:predicted small metal-binding protein